MSKECINCGCKVGFFAGEHFGGLLCDHCYNILGGLILFELETEYSPQKYIEGYERIKHVIDEKAASNDIKNQISPLFFEKLDLQFKRINNEEKGIYEYIADKIEREKYEKEREKYEKERDLRNTTYANSFNEFYEYDVITIINEGHGTVDKEKMMKILSDHAKKGWKLHTVYSNELGKNALGILGISVNSTACEDVLIFERRVPDLEE